MNSIVKVNFTAGKVISENCNLSCLVNHKNKVCIKSNMTFLSDRTAYWSALAPGELGGCGSQLQSSSTNEIPCGLV